MFVSGTSTHKVGEVTKTLLGVTPSASTVSRLNQTLTEQFDACRVRPLQQQWRIVYLDGIHFTIRHGKQCDSSIILTVLGVDPQGNKEVLALRACAEESKEGWLSILQDILYWLLGTSVQKYACAGSLLHPFNNLQGQSWVDRLARDVERGK